MTQANLVFILKILLSILGVIGFVVLGGTWLKAIYVYLFYTLVSVFATAGYHRWISHNNIEPTTAGKLILTISMIITGLVRPFTYAVMHRNHHKFSDTINDPHPPTIGFYNVLMGNYNLPVIVPVKDLLRKKYLVLINKYFYQLHILSFILLGLIDKDLFLLGFCFIQLRYHLQAAIFNYIAHGGKSNTGPKNLSTLPGIFFWGEQLHYNHHQNQNLANMGSISRINFDWMYVILNKCRLIRIIP